MSEPTTAELVERVEDGFSGFERHIDDAAAALTALQSRCEDAEKLALRHQTCDGEKLVLQSRCEELEREAGTWKASRDIWAEESVEAVARAERAEATVQRLREALESLMAALTTDDRGNLVGPPEQWLRAWTSALVALDQSGESVVDSGAVSDGPSGAPGADSLALSEEPRMVGDRETPLTREWNERERKRVSEEPRQ